MVDSYTFPQNLALICLTVSEKTRFTDDDGRPRHGISSSDSQAELIIPTPLSEYRP